MPQARINFQAKRTRPSAKPPGTLYSITLSAAWPGSGVQLEDRWAAVGLMCRNLRNSTALGVHARRRRNCQNKSASKVVHPKRVEFHFGTGRSWVEGSSSPETKPYYTPRPAGDGMCAPRHSEFSKTACTFLSLSPCNLASTSLNSTWQLEHIHSPSAVGNAKGGVT